MQYAIYFYVHQMHKKAHQHALQLIPCCVLLLQSAAAAAAQSPASCSSVAHAAHGLAQKAQFLQLQNMFCCAVQGISGMRSSAPSITALLLLIAPVLLVLAAPFDWTYNEDSENQLPPSQWHRKHEACAGTSQSPILLSKSNTTPCGRRQEAFIFYGGDCTLANVASKPLPSNWGETHLKNCTQPPYLMVRSNTSIMLCV
jgi:hypothetical protein